MLTFGSLFAGIGGGDLGLERCGFRCAWQVEKDPFCRKVLAKHWPDIPRYEDVLRFPGGAAEPLKVDLIIGGDPCQENSGARVLKGCTAPSLGQEFLRVISILRPEFVVRENPSRVRPDAPWPWWKFRDALRELGYRVEPIKTRACCFGYPHRRERMLLLAQHADSDREPFRVPRRGEDATEEGRVQEAARERQRLWSDHLPVVRGERPGPVGGLRRGYDGIPGGVDKLRLKALGNALVPDVAEWVGRILLRSLSKKEGE